MCSVHGSFLQLLWDWNFFSKIKVGWGRPLCYHNIILLCTCCWPFLHRPPFPDSLPLLFPLHVGAPRDSLVHMTQSSRPRCPFPWDGHLPQHLQISSQKLKSQSLSSIDNPTLPSWLLSRESQSPNPISFSSLLATPSWRLRPASPSFSALVPATPKSFLASLVPVVLTFFSEW